MTHVHMSNRAALLISLKAAHRRWAAIAAKTDFRTEALPLAVLSANEVRAIKLVWPDIKGLRADNTIMPSVLQAAIRQLEQLPEPVEPDEDFLEEERLPCR
jgi:hypothetical protein